VTPPLVDLLRQPAVVYADSQHAKPATEAKPCHNLVCRKIDYTPAVKK
jgi:hypothetical protein